MMHKKHALLDTTLLLSIALLLGRLAGFGRELLLASFLGMSAQADIAVVLLTVPDLLVNLLLSGGIGVALIPALRTASSTQATALFYQASLTIGGLFALLGFAFAYAPSLWLGLLAPGVDTERLMLNHWIGYTLGGAIMLTALSGVTTAALNARNQFFVAGCGTLIFNVAVISALGLMLMRDDIALTWLAWGIFAGALLRWFVQQIALRSFSFSSTLQFSKTWLINKPLLKAFTTGMTAASLLVLVPVILRACASFLGQGQLAAFNYAFKLIELPLVIFITAVATVTFPRLSEAFQRKNGHMFDALLIEAILRSLLMSLAVVLCGWPVMNTIVPLLFDTGKLSPQNLAHLTKLAQIALLSVPWIGLAGLTTVALNAKRQPGRVLRRTLVTILVLPLLSFPGVWMENAGWVMWAFPLFYALLSLHLLLGEKCFMLGFPRTNRTFVVQIAIIFGAIVLAGYLLDTWFFIDRLDQSNRWNMIGRIALFSLMFLAMIGAGMRALHRNRVENF